jgi:hypothetical protein
VERGRGAREGDREEHSLGRVSALAAWLGGARGADGRLDLVGDGELADSREEH